MAATGRAGFHLAGLLAGLASEPPGGPVPAAELDELRVELDRAATVLVADLPPEARPLRLPKDRVASVLDCERFTLAVLGAELALSEPLVMGTLVDRLVARHVFPGTALGPTATSGEADVLDEVLAALVVSGADEVVAWIDACPVPERQRLARGLGEVATALTEGWGPVEPRWWPRVQVPAEVWLAGDAVVASTRFDLLLGGPLTGRAGVLVEVKSGPARPSHRSDLHWYALIAALRHRWAPDVVATWSAADDTLRPEPVNDGMLEAAARRGLAALGRLADLAGGREPTETAGARCGWCPDADRCSTGQAALRLAGSDDP